MSNRQFSGRHAIPRFALCALFAAALGLCLGACRSSQMTLSRMVIYTKPWDLHGSYDLPPALVVRRYANSARMVESGPFLDSVDAGLGTIDRWKPLDSVYFDPSIVCLLHKRSSAVDTLSFGGWVMNLNGALYRTDTTLLKLVASKLDRVSQTHIRRMLDNP